MGGGQGSSPGWPGTRHLPVLVLELKAPHHNAGCEAVLQKIIFIFLDYNCIMFPFFFFPPDSCLPLDHCCDAFKMISSMTNFGVEFVMVISNVSTHSLKTGLNTNKACKLRFLLKYIS